MSKIFPGFGAVVFSQHVTPWLFFRSSSQSDDYNQFRSSQTNIWSNVLLQLFCTLIFFVFKLSGIVYFPSILATISFITTLFIPIVLGWLTIFLRIFKSTEFSWTTLCSNDRLINLLESFWLVGTCASFSLGVIAIGYNGQCPPRHVFFANIACSDSSPHQMPEGLMMISLIFPIMLFTIMKGAKRQYLFLSFTLNVFAILFTMYAFDLTQSLGGFIGFIPICLLFMYEKQRQNISIFLLTQNQDHLLHENERLERETQANELKHLIGNVAHDLKTVKVLSLIKFF